MLLVLVEQTRTIFNGKLVLKFPPSAIMQPFLMLQLSKEIVLHIDILFLTIASCLWRIEEKAPENT
jgi:hypothetical protein